MSRVATNIIEVRDGCAKNYLGNYQAYVYSINQEIDAGERETANAKRMSGPSAIVPERKSASNRDLQKVHRKRQKEIKNIEKKIAQLDEEKKTLNQQLLETTDASEALRLHTQFTDVSEKFIRQCAGAIRKVSRLAGHVTDFRTGD